MFRNAVSTPVSVIIPTLNEEGYLPKLLASLATVRSPLDVIVVDGCSEDKTEEATKTFATAFQGTSSLRFVQAGTRGISLQRNRGAALARFDTLIFCDADIVFPSSEVFEDIVSQFVQSGSVVAAPVLVPIEKEKGAGFFYGTFVCIQRLLLLLGRPYFAGSCLISTKHVFTAIGGFNERIMLAEDVDYSLRARHKGRAVLIEVKLLVSARRIIKYGYGWALSELPNIVRLFATGRVLPDTIYYPFGEYGSAKAHHVTNNQGKRLSSTLTVTSVRGRGGSEADNAS